MWYLTMAVVQTDFAGLAGSGSIYDCCGVWCSGRQMEHSLSKDDDKVSHNTDTHTRSLSVWVPHYV